jgi:hypothetical protein
MVPEFFRPSGTPYGETPPHFAKILASAYIDPELRGA